MDIHQFTTHELAVDFLRWYAKFVNHVVEDHIRCNSPYAHESGFHLGPKVRYTKNNKYLKLKDAGEYGGFWTTLAYVELATGDIFNPTKKGKCSKKKIGNISDPENNGFDKMMGNLF